MDGSNHRSWFLVVGTILVLQPKMSERLNVVPDR